MSAYPEQGKQQFPILMCAQQGNYRWLPKRPLGLGIQMETLRCIWHKKKGNILTKRTQVTSKENEKRELKNPM